MHKRLWSYILVVIATLAVASVWNPLTALQGLAQSGCQSFPQTGKQVCGKFLQYWQQHGGLAQQGYPISGEFTEVSDLNGKPYTVQYFERAVFELHPENQPPYDVLLSQLGTLQFKRKYPQGEPGGGSQGANPAPTQPAAQPGAGIVGQTFDYTPFGGKTTFHAQVTDVKELTSIPKTDFTDEQKPQGKFVAVLMKVGNTGKEPGIFFSGDFRLKDSSGRSFDTSGNILATIGAGKLYNAKTPGDNVQPGFTDTFVLLFDVPTNATGYTLVRH